MNTQKRKSIVASFGDLTSDTPPEKSAGETGKAGNPPKRMRRVPAGVVGQAARSMASLTEDRDRLLQSLEEGDKLILIDPELIDPSPFQDRLPDDNDSDFEDFKQSLKEEGQKVPIIIRPHPETVGRYQIVYGRRRTRALRDLGKQVEAVVRPHSDSELVIAQGIENSRRQDLSWIERAIFADAMEEGGVRPRDIKAALCVDDAQLSKFRTVVSTLGREVIEAIGRAPKIGRPRWLELEAFVAGKSDQKKILKTLSADKVLGLASNDRFQVALACLSPQSSKNDSTEKPRDHAIGDIGTMKVSGQKVQITLDEEYAEFREFLVAEMDTLLEKFMRSKNGGS